MKFPSAPSVSLVFDRKHTASATRKATVQLEILYRRQRSYLSTGIRLFADQWKAGCVVHTPAAPETNRLLAQILSYAEAEAAKLHAQGRFDLRSFASQISRSPLMPSFDLLQAIADDIETRPDIRETTRRMHRKLVPALKAAGIASEKDLTPSAIIAFDAFLHRQGIRQTTVYTYHKLLKTYLRRLRLREAVSADPYAGLHFDRGRSSIRLYLAPDELARLRRVKLPPHLARARDLFLFQCFTGLAYADLAAFDPSRLVRSGGRLVLRGSRRKSGEPYYVVLVPQAVEILRSYGGSLPILSNEAYNRALRIVAASASIPRLTSHMGRHTFATLAISSGVPVATLARMLGHSDVRTTQVYARVLDSEVERSFDLLSPAFSF